MNAILIKIAVIVVTLVPLQSFGQNVELSDKAVDTMKYLLEEEKVAGDVYTYLGETWGLRVFHNIKQSEQRHLEMMESLLNTNQITYQLSNERGVFYNQDLQEMYDMLIEKGSKSKQEALKVGKLIEETDIKDLEEALKNTDDSYARQIYSNLISASHRHLQAFTRNLSK